jgi:rhodanese-related sulfurtransferase
MTPDRRITVTTALATFLALTAISVVVWAFTRPDAPAPVTVAAASVMPEPEQFERITVDELKPLVDAGKAVLIDVRSAEQFVAGHIGGALHIPVASVEGEIEYLPKDKELVTYCTCPNEESSGQAALILQHRGVKARALQGGLDAWTGRGYATVAGVK